MPTLHYSTDGTWFDYDAGRDEQGPAGGNDFHGRKKLTEDYRAVTCRTCRELCGFDDLLTDAIHARGFASDVDVRLLRETERHERRAAA